MDVLLIQWRISLALDEVGRQVQELAQTWGGAPEESQPCEPDPVTGELPLDC